jgi:hypothetical protein
MIGRTGWAEETCAGGEKKEVTMATVKEINGKIFCDTVYTELSGMKKRIDGMREDLARTYGEKTELLEKFDRHLGELAGQIEWKLEILSHACPYDWNGSVEFAENVVSVPRFETAIGPDFSGGYLGG